MSEDKTADITALWKNQPSETPVNLEGLRNRRRNLDSATRSEILIGLAAALFFIAIIVWQRPDLMKDPVSQRAFLIVVAWVLVSLYRFRDRIWPREPGRKDALAVPGLEYYRNSLQRRRNHLRNAWLWHGPLFLACAIFLTLLAGGRIIAFRGLQRVLPLVVLLAAWTVFGILRRLRQAKELQREIDEIPTSPAG